jgi:predicted Rossmann fold nucleotide-binding protein DprA/Smf involved in DNA uptake
MEPRIYRAPCRESIGRVDARDSPLKIVSGGQTGVDRAALDAAMVLGIACGGWCPRGRRAEDGRIPARYPLIETPTARYPQRTQWNVRDSDGTLVLHAGRPRGGTALTLRLVAGLGRPLLRVDLDESPDPQALTAWIARAGIRVLNVAGPRESECPGVGSRAKQFLEKALGPRQT